MKNIILALIAANTAHALKKGTATTTRYWDCSGGSCGCGFGNPDQPTHCHSNSLFAAPKNNKWGAKYYGSAAISNTLGGGSWNAPGCGKCFKVTGTSNVQGNNGSKSTIILKGTNWCPPSNGVCAGKDHFDIAVPGFDFAEASEHDTCAQAEPNEPSLKAP